ncbi:hypothetical protein K8M07_02310 [Schnuerera sp. xch1]|uniref:hypothetical protein n=1 Tax=Schnuerera sp. xch1 TaxID=2874283 RepID=UPI001CBF84C6|nr:hypothetical protein [Schnuerera sp. xch1]MBZ2174089.1 hypothetical protein [Schnuerera sp. xch1]
MKFKYHKLSILPKLSWCAVTTHKSSEIHIYHGNGVETFEDFFVEGAWDGDFCSGDFDESEFFMGSGGKMSENGSGGVILATSNHTLERLYSISEESVIYISNSLPFILYMSDSELESKYLSYETVFNSILKGINKYTKMIPLNEGKKINLHYYCNILLNDKYELLELQKNEIKSFKDYEDYENRLVKALKTFVNNAQDPERKIKYELTTTISKGYDAAACAAMAYEVGCEKVVSFDKPQKYADDCGDDIAKKLGYKSIITKNANEYLNNKSLVEAEFVSSGELGTGIVFTAFEKEFKNSVVFIGERGDKIWDKNRTDYNNYFRFENEVFTSTSMVENRLRIGYIIIPMPLFGASQWPSIHKISNSDEMKSYSIGGNYDRPIPRRILETRGIDRNMFGVEKKGAGFNYRFDNLGRIKKRMSKKSYDSFYNFYINNKRNKLKAIKAWIRFLRNTKSLYISYFLRKVGFHVKNSKLTADATSNPGAPSYLFNWGVYEMINKYKKSKIDRWWI